jgi:hypothetical protein
MIYNSINNLLCISISSYSMRGFSDYNTYCIDYNTYNYKKSYQKHEYKNEYLWIQQQIEYYWDFGNDIDDNIILYKYLGNLTQIDCCFDSISDIDYYQYTLNQIILDNEEKYSFNKIDSDWDLDSVDDIEDILIAVIINFQYDYIDWDLNKNITTIKTENSIIESNIVDCFIKLCRNLLEYDNIHYDIDNLNNFYTDSYFRIIYILYLHIVH